MELIRFIHGAIEFVVNKPVVYRSVICQCQTNVTCTQMQTASLVYCMESHKITTVEATDKYTGLSGPGTKWASTWLMPFPTEIVSTVHKILKTILPNNLINIISVIR